MDAVGPRDGWMQASSPSAILKKQAGGGTAAARDRR